MKLFLPQSTLEQWVLDEKADVREGKLSGMSGSAALPLEEAFHVLATVSGEDSARLVARVKTQAQLDALGAERIEGSLLLGDTVYEGVPGYLIRVEPGSIRTQDTSEEQALLEAMFLKQL